MEPRGISIALVSIGLCIGGVSGMAAEKIKFSTPSQATGVATEAKDIHSTTPNLFDKFRNGGADALHLPMALPQQRTSQPSSDEKKDWILATPEDGVPSPEEMFNRKGAGEKQPDNGLARYVQEVERQDSEADALLREKRLERESYDYSGRDARGFDASIVNPNSAFDTEKLGRENFSFSEYWKETTGMNPERYAEQTDLRRAEFQQIFETRASQSAIAGLDGNNPVQPGKLLAPAPTDFNSRTSQSSISDSYQNGYMPLTGSRSTVLDDVNSRALGRESGSTLNRAIEQPQILSKPAILPFPTRPGELFKRPGSY